VAGQLIPPPELAPPALDRLTPAQRGEAWLNLLRLGEDFVLTRLRRQVGPDGDVRAAYQAWYWERMAEHDRMIEQMLRRMSRMETCRRHFQNERAEAILSNRQVFLESN
jgi:hypothetical protein